jgi:uncharacterized protein
VPDLESLLVCPACHGSLARQGERITCGDCRRVYPVEDEIPVLLVDGKSSGQAAFFDESVDDEFEIERPYGTPPLHRWLLEEKFRRSVQGIEKLLPEATVAAVCAGSGMDAEFLARAGSRVLALDISIGAARRVKERARRHGVELTSVVADAQSLPLRDRSVDVAYVHDGLHHLEQPEAGLAEMARVAAVAVSVNEPADAGITKVAVRLGLALSVEPAGNRVARLDPPTVAAQLEERGFEVVEAGRYGMYYRHEPGRVVRGLSRRAPFAASRGMFLVLNRAGGRWGNKLSVKVRRRSGDRQEETATR